MRLFELAYACRIYAGVTEFDKGYKSFVKAVGKRIDLGSSKHLKELLKWLNSWGCRQFAIKYHANAMESIKQWAHKWESKLPDRNISLEALSEKEIDIICEAYDSLSKQFASKRQNGSKKTDVKIGHTGAAKILFAIRPNTLPPWDIPIRKAFGFDGEPASYGNYLRQVREKVQELCSDARRYGLEPNGIGSAVDRPNSSLPKLVDEYNWVTLTKKVNVPGLNILNKWLKWL